MVDELADLLDTAIYREIASQALYEAAQNKTGDGGAINLLKELAGEEGRHAELLKEFRDKGAAGLSWHGERVVDLKISQYLVAPDTVAGAGLQETLIFAMKHEQQAVEFYGGLMSIFRDEAAKRLCERLVHEELKHKLRLEMAYDDLFYGEN